MNGNSYRDGKVHVMAELCPTCIFRPGNLMDLKPGRVKGMVAEAVREDTAIICHSTLDRDHAVCRGFYDGYRTLPLVLATVMGVVEEV